MKYIKTNREAVRVLIEGGKSNQEIAKILNISETEIPKIKTELDIKMDYSKNNSDLEGELWEPLIGFEKYYEISNMGRLKRLYSESLKSNGVKQIIREKILKGCINTSGYPSFFIGNDGKSKQYRLHRLVALQFIPNPENKPQINHKNGIKTDNRVENLEWCTHSENQLHAIRTGLKKYKSGEDHCNSKLTDLQILEVRELIKNKEGLIKDIASKFGVSRDTIRNIKQYKNRYKNKTQ